jgi:hypothetical protein
LIQDINKEDKKVEEVMDYKEEMILEIKRIHKDQKKVNNKVTHLGKDQVIKVEVDIIINIIMIDHHQGIEIEIMIVVDMINVVGIHVNVVEIGSQENGEVGRISKEGHGIIIMSVEIIVIIMIEGMIKNRIIVKEENIKAIIIIIIIRKECRIEVNRKKVMLEIIDVI